MNFFLAWVGALLLPRPDAVVGSGLDYLDAAIASIRSSACSCSISC